MRIRVLCDCGQKLVADERLARKKIKCPICHQLIRLPQPEDVTSQPIAWHGPSDTGIDLSDSDQDLPVEALSHKPPSTYDEWMELKGSRADENANDIATTTVQHSDAESESPTVAAQLIRELNRPRLRIFVLRYLCVIAAIGWIFTFHSPAYSRAVAIHYACLFAFVAYIALEAARKICQRTKWRLFAAIIAASAACWAWPHFDTYESHWQNDHGTSFVDSYLRSGQMWHRSLTLKKDEDEVLGYSTEGPMSGNPPRPHGHWTGTTWKPKFKEEHLWFWYGEAITQGEWELRNK